MKQRSGKVRVIGGRWRGTRLHVADSPGLRPTSDRARETLFNWLQPALPGARVLDLFAGSGVLGIEALSRGAAQALLIEREPSLAQAIEDSLQRLGADAEARVVRADAVGFLRLPAHGRFDIVFVDPPFDAGLLQPALAALDPWLADDAWLYLETPPAGAVEPGEGWQPHREMRTRDARHALYRRTPAGPARE